MPSSFPGPVDDARIKDLAAVSKDPVNGRAAVRALLEMAAQRHNQVEGFGSEVIVRFVESGGDVKLLVEASVEARAAQDPVVLPLLEFLRQALL